MAEGEDEQPSVGREKNPGEMEEQEQEQTVQGSN